MNNPSANKFGPLLGVISVGDKHCKFLIYAAKNGEVLTCHETKINQLTPRPGYIELDPIEIWENVVECIEKGTKNLEILDISIGDIKAVGITNIGIGILWNKSNGRPYCNAMSTFDVRSDRIVDALLTRTKNKINYLKSVCGLPINGCFSAIKLMWMMENVPEVVEGIACNECLFGTLDSWLLWNLTGGSCHYTDVSNASRTMLMNLETLNWDNRLLKFFRIPASVLPTIKSSSEIYGYVCSGPLTGVPISSCIGDQQAALLGQLCVSPGQVNCSFDDGCCLMFNTAQEIIDSSNGLISTVAYKLGPNEKCCYALEGTVANAGSAIDWLKDTLAIQGDVSSSTIFQSVMCETPPTMFSSLTSMQSSLTFFPQDFSPQSQPDPVVFVPAFNGIQSPHWKKARGMLMGLTADTTAQSIIYAAYEALCYQTREILDALRKDCRTWPKLNKLIVGGELSDNAFFLQTLANLCGIQIEKPQSCNPSSLGAALAAGLAINIIKIDTFRTEISPPILTFYPTLNPDQQEIKFNKWKFAVKKCINWEHGDINYFICDKGPQQYVRDSIPGGIFFFTSFALLCISHMIQK